MPTIPPSRIAPPPVQKQKRGASSSAWLLWLLLPGCAAGGVAAVGAPSVGGSHAVTVPDVPGVAASGPAATRIDPRTDGNAPMPPGLAALRDELQRGMTELKAKGNPAPYYIGYEVHDRTEVVVSASYGALVQSSSRRARILDTDVRVGDYRLDSTHAIRSDDFDYSSALSGHAVTLPLSDDPGALRSVAWLETDRRYKEAAERLVKVKTQRTLKVADEDPSDDFSHEKPVTYIGQAAAIEVDVPAWEKQDPRAVGALSQAGRDLRFAGDVAGGQPHALAAQQRGLGHPDRPQLRARLPAGRDARRRRHGAGALRELRRRVVRFAGQASPRWRRAPTR